MSFRGELLTWRDYAVAVSTLFIVITLAIVGAISWQIMNDVGDLKEGHAASTATIDALDKRLEGIEQRDLPTIRADIRSLHRR